MNRTRTTSNATLMAPTEAFSPNDQKRGKMVRVRTCAGRDASCSRFPFFKTRRSSPCHVSQVNSVHKIHQKEDIVGKAAYSMKEKGDEFFKNEFEGQFPDSSNAMYHKCMNDFIQKFKATAGKWAVKAAEYELMDDDKNASPSEMRTCKELMEDLEREKDAIQETFHNKLSSKEFETLIKEKEKEEEEREKIANNAFNSLSKKKAERYRTKYHEFAGKYVLAFVDNRIAQHFGNDQAVGYTASTMEQEWLAKMEDLLKKTEKKEKKRRNRKDGKEAGGGPATKNSTHTGRARVGRERF